MTTSLTQDEREQRCRAEKISHEHYTRETVEQIIAARMADLGMVCDAYGLPHDAVGLARHIESNAALTTEVWKQGARIATARLAAVEAAVTEVSDLADHHTELLSDFEDGFAEGACEAHRVLRAALPVRLPD